MIKSFLPSSIIAVLLIGSNLMVGCKSENSVSPIDFSLKFKDNKKEYQLGSRIEALLQNPKNHVVDSVKHRLKYEKQWEASKNFSRELDDEKLGTHWIQTIVYVEGKPFPINTAVTILNNKAPKIYSYNIVNTYKHNNTYFTQGLEFDQNAEVLYESTGHYRKSKLTKYRIKPEYETLKEIPLQDDIFGEGLTLLNNKIIQLTWQYGVGFIYNQETFEKINEFHYQNSKEGWGICNDGNKLYKSDGTEKIWTLNPENYQEEDYIQVTTNKSVKKNFNELEWVNGKILANTWQKNGIAIINPKNGALEGVINGSGLSKLVDRENPKADVLNGIAYNPKSKTLFVTGKHWDKLFEIEIVDAKTKEKVSW